MDNISRRSILSVGLGAGLVAALPGAAIATSTADDASLRTVAARGVEEARIEIAYAACGQAANTSTASANVRNAVVLTGDVHRKGQRHQGGLQGPGIARTSITSTGNVLDYVTTPGSPVSTKASYAIHDGVPGLQARG